MFFRNVSEYRFSLEIISLILMPDQNANRFESFWNSTTGAISGLSSKVATEAKR